MRPASETSYVVIAVHKAYPEVMKTMLASYNLNYKYKV